MLNIEVNKIPYKAFHQWDEMPLSLAITIHTLISESIPPKLREFYSIVSGQGNQEEKEKDLTEWYNTLTDDERIKQLPLFYGKAIALLTTIPAEIIKHLGAADRDVFYKTFCESFVYGILYWPSNFTAKGINSFKHNDVEYFLPLTKNIMGVDRPFFDRSAIEFTESADLEIFSKEMRGGKYEVAANIISILCRPYVANNSISPTTFYPENIRPKKNAQKIHEKDIAEYVDKIKAYPKTIIEPYNEEVCLERAKQFLDLKMNIVFEVFFCLAQHITILHQLMTISLQQGVLNDIRNLNKAESKSSVGMRALSKWREQLIMLNM